METWICHYCGRPAEFKVLMEDDENWTRSVCVSACSECLPTIDTVIETWTRTEWDEED